MVYERGITWTKEFLARELGRTVVKMIFERQVRRRAWGCLFKKRACGGLWLAVAFENDV